MAFVHDGPVPVTVVTGFLGAGKTTLLNHILTGGHGLRIAVIQNEFADLGIDADLIVAVDEDIYELSSGCLCCTVRDDLVRVLEDLMERRRRFDHIVLETTGLAAPGPVVMTLLNHPDHGSTFRLEGVVTVVDAKHLPRQLEETDEARQQIAFADIVLINKLDLTEEGERAAVEESVRSINPLARIVGVVNAAIDPWELLEIGGFDPARVALPEGREGSHEHSHTGDIGSVGIVLEGEVDLVKFEAWIDLLLLLNHEDLFRFKGILSPVGEERYYVAQGVHALHTGQFAKVRGDAPPRNRLVFIGRNLNGAILTAGFRATLAAPGA